MSDALVAFFLFDGATITADDEGGRMTRNGKHMLMIGAVAGAIAIVVAGCDESTYEQGPAPQPTATPEPETPRSSGSRGGSAYGGAMRAGERTADRVEDHQQRLLDEMRDE